MRIFAVLALLLSALSAVVPDARASVDLRLRGYISSDARFSLPGYFDKAFTGRHPRFIRNETEANVHADFGFGRHVLGVADVTLVYTGKRDTLVLSDTSVREKVDPFRIESDALYVTFRDLGLEGLDLSVGRMIRPWGTGDMFNPTRNLNSLDLEDRLAFGESVANQMIVLEWAPGWTVEGEEDTIFDELFFEVAVVPVFRGALLPDSALVAFSEPALARTRFHSQVMAELFDLQDAFLSRGGSLSFDVHTEDPSVDLRNVQLGARFGFHLVGVDVSFSYYRGFDDVLQPQAVYAEDVVFRQMFPITSGDPLGIIEGACAAGEGCLGGTNVHTRIRLAYPRIQVVGFDMATSLDFLGGLGLWAEVAMVFHEDSSLQVRTSDVILPTGGAGTPVGIAQTRYDLEYSQGFFVKAVVGLDYTILPWWYVNAQYLHGFVDEFGADSLKDYAVVGSDFKFLDERILLRIFALFCFQDQSAVLYPQLTFRPWAAAELTFGALLYFGEQDSTFGTPLTGPSTFFLKAKMSF